MHEYIDIGSRGTKANSFHAHYHQCTFHSNYSLPLTIFVCVVICYFIFSKHTPLGTPSFPPVAEAHPSTFEISPRAAEVSSHSANQNREMESKHQEIKKLQSTLDLTRSDRDNKQNQVRALRDDFDIMNSRVAEAQSQCDAAYKNYLWFTNSYQDHIAHAEQQARAEVQADYNRQVADYDQRRQNREYDRARRGLRPGDQSEAYARLHAIDEAKANAERQLPSIRRRLRDNIDADYEHLRNKRDNTEKVLADYSRERDTIKARRLAETDDLNKIDRKIQGLESTLRILKAEFSGFAMGNNPMSIKFD